MQKKTEDHTLFELLRGSDLLCETDERLVTHFAEKWDCSIFIAILETKLLSESVLCERLAAAYGFPLFNINMLDVVPLDIYKKISFPFAQENLILPAAITADGKIRIVIANPSARSTLEDIISRLGLSPEFVVGEAREILSLLNERFPVELQVNFLISCAVDGDKNAQTP